MCQGTGMHSAEVAVEEEIPLPTMTYRDAGQNAGAGFDRIQRICPKKVSLGQ